MTLADHVRELRYRLLICVGAIVLGMLPAWFLYNPLIRILNTPYCDALVHIDPESQCRFLVTNILNPFALRLKVAGYGGVFLAMPVILWQLWRFLAPGLYKKERRYALSFTVSALLLFSFGAFVAFFTLNQAVQFLVRIGGPDIDVRSGPNEFVKLALFMMLSFGTGFLFPLVLVALQMMGVVTPQKLSSWRRQIVLIIVVVAAVITPSGDPISLAALSVPMYLFYEVAVIAGRLMSRRRNREDPSETSEAIA